MKPPLPIISAIAAMAVNRVIGANNQLPWRMPADLKHFKEITSGHAVVMGRKTYESIGKPLPNRTNIVLTRNRDYKAPGCLMASSIEEAAKLAKDHDELFVIGGAEIYTSCLPLVSRIFLTVVHHEFDGDAHFPVLNHKEWNEVQLETHAADIDNPFEYSFITLDKITAPVSNDVNNTITDNGAMIW